MESPVDKPVSRESRLLKKPERVKDLALGMAAYTGASILGPLLLFLGLGYIADYFVDTRPLFMIIGLLAAFFVTNFLIYKKITRLIRQVEEMENDRKKEDKDETGNNTDNDQA
jgi:F0F1-type ATP synthase assembly protein I